MIRERILTAGNKLPSTRHMAEIAAVSRETAEMVYGQLQAEGYLVRHTGRGSFVDVNASLSPRKNVYKQPLASTPYRADGTISAISQRSKAYIAAGKPKKYKKTQMFVVDIPETRYFPIAIWERLQKQALRDHWSTAHLCGELQGIEPLRQAIADYINMERGANAHPDQVLILNSVQQAFVFCANIIADPGEDIIMEDPGYCVAKTAFKSAGVNILSVPVDKNGIVTDSLPVAKAAYVTPSHQYPTGSTLSLQRRMALIEWAQKSNAWIIEDDNDSDFHYDGPTMACIYGLDQFDRTIHIGTFSRTLFPDIRLAYIVFPKLLQLPFRNLAAQMNGHVSQLTQLTLSRFIDSGFFGSHVRVMHKQYQQRREILAATVESHLKNWATPLIPSGGLRMPCFLHPEIDEKRTILAALSAGVNLPSLSYFYCHAAPKKGWLLGFSAFSPDEIKDAVARLAAELRRLRF